jgi:hypothetical protein
MTFAKRRICVRDREVSRGPISGSLRNSLSFSFDIIRAAKGSVGRRVHRLGTSLCAVSVLSGCAHLPAAQVTYYLPTSVVRLNVIRTVACDSANNLIVGNSVTPAVTNKADIGQAYHIDLAKLRGTFSDSDLAFTYTSDGRISSLNATQTGQGEAALKTAITIATAVLTAGVGLAAPVNLPALCKTIKQRGGDKPLTLTYSGTVDLTKGPDDMQPILVDDTSAADDDLLSPVIGEVQAYVMGHTVPAAPVTLAEPAAITLRARQPGTVEIKVEAGRDGGQIYDDSIVVANFHQDYDVPIPGAAVFGTKSLAITFADSGALTNLEFVSKSGAGQALNVAQAGVDAVNGRAADQAAAAKAQADLIAEQQRLVACRADATKCTTS